MDKFVVLIMKKERKEIDDTLKFYKLMSKAFRTIVYFVVLNIGLYARVTNHNKKSYYSKNVFYSYFKAQSIA